MKNSELENMDFDDYLWECYFELKEQKSNDVFYFDSALNRNQEQVPDQLWSTVLLNHLNRNYN